LNKTKELQKELVNYMVSKKLKIVREIQPSSIANYRYSSSGRLASELQKKN